MTKVALTDAEIAEALQVCERATPGHQEKHVGGPVYMACMDAAARALLGESQEKWAEWQKRKAELGLPPSHDDVYSFAYWLFRYSGLVIPQARTVLPRALKELQELRQKVSEK